MHKCLIYSTKSAIFYWNWEYWKSEYSHHKDNQYQEGYLEFDLLKYEVYLDNTLKPAFLDVSECILLFFLASDILYLRIPLIPKVNSNKFYCSTLADFFIGFIFGHLLGWIWLFFDSLKFSHFLIYLGFWQLFTLVICWDILVGSLISCLYWLSYWSFCLDRY